MDKISTMKYIICAIFNQSGDLINILGMIGIAILTALIPVAIAIFNNEVEEYKALDKKLAEENGQDGPKISDN